VKRYILPADRLPVLSADLFPSSVSKKWYSVPKHHQSGKVASQKRFHNYSMLVMEN